MNFELLKNLCETPAIAGNEEAIRSLIAKELKKHADEMWVDVMGNIIAYKKGKGSTPRKKVMIAGHMDEIGFVVKYIDDKGFIRIHPLGGFDPKQLFAQRVLVTTKENVYKGILTYSSKPVHMQTDAEKSASPQLDNFFVDLGLPAETVKEKVSIGDMITMDRTTEKLGENIVSKALDDRIGVYCAMEAFKAAKDLSIDLCFVGTVQEEIGLRGATTSSYELNPDIAIAIDITLANDYPGPGEADMVTKLGNGAAIKIMDGSLICHPKLVDHFKKIAEKNKITYQIELLPRGGTDAGAMQRSRGGAAGITLSIPTRYVHTVNELICEKDVDATVELLNAYLADAHNADYEYKV